MNIFFYHSNEVYEMSKAKSLYCKVNQPANGNKAYINNIAHCDSAFLRLENSKSSAIKEYKIHEIQYMP